jgi:photosystem II stability/assembly factor-like uncharacterized protein
VIRPRVVLAILLVASPLAFAPSPSGRVTNPYHAVVAAQPAGGSPFTAMRWRSIGPYRAGRTKAVTGVPGKPHTFLVGVVNGGVWRTDDAGRTWQPLFDRQPTGSIGDVAVAPSDPDVIYVGSGEGLHRPDLSTGDGLYKSTDGGRTWTHLGLRDGQQIPRVVVDPRDPNRLFVAVLGHPYGPNEERGVYRSTDGGRTFQRVLYKDPDTGASDVDLDPTDPNTVYACLWQAQEGPWENAEWGGTNGGIFKSTDGGATWRQLTAGLPTGDDAVQQADLAVAPSDPNRLYASVATGGGTAIYRSDDAGESWTKITNDARPAARIGGGDLPVLTVSPEDADIVFSASVVMWKSTDGGRTWTGLRGAPGGDDYQRVWVSPDDPDVMAAASDQGAIVSLNGGRTWSSWYALPTAQLYHVAADNAFPYRVCSGQQESGSACVASRGNDGEITFRDWHPVGVDEYGYAAPDPLDPDVVYGGRRVTRYDRRTGQVATVGPSPTRSGDFRTVRTAPVLFSPIDPHTLYFAANTLWKTADGGRTWQQISPDLTRKTWAVPESVGIYKDAPSARPTQRGVIYTVAPSSVDANTIWIGTDDGLIQVTHDGGRTWTDVTPKALVPWAKVSLMDAGHADAQTAYAAVNTIRLDDLRPHIYRTHDGGRTWTEIVTGIPDGGPINVVREDPQRKGLLFAGSEREVYVSLDDGGHWESLRLNMPATSVRDLIVKDDDLVAATHGRGFWILDDITPLRQIGGPVTAADAYLFKPQVATRVRWDLNTDTPLPPDEPAGQNPPDGAILDYWLKADQSGPVTLEILDGSGALVRRYASDDPIAPIDPNLPIPTYWVRPTQRLSNAAGLHRFVWDLHYPPAPGSGVRYPIAAVAHETAPAPTSPWVPPGDYTVRLTAGGRTDMQPLTVRMDPRVTTPPEALAQQFTLSKELYDGIVVLQNALARLRGARQQVAALRGRAQGVAAAALAAFDQKAAALEGGGGGGRFGGGSPGTLSGASAALAQLMGLLQAADVAPTPAVVTAVGSRQDAMGDVMARWSALRSQDLAALNAELRQAGLPTISAGGM